MEDAQGWIQFNLRGPPIHTGSGQVRFDSTETVWVRAASIVAVKATRDSLENYRDGNGYVDRKLATLWLSEGTRIPLTDFPDSVIEAIERAIVGAAGSSNPCLEAPIP